MLKYFFGSLFFFNKSPNNDISIRAAYEYLNDFTVAKVDLSMQLQPWLQSSDLKKTVDNT